MAKNTSVALDDHFDNFISERVAAGRYGSASEMVRAGLRMLEVEENKLIALQAAIDIGLASGVAKKFDIDELQQRMDAELGTE